MKYLFPKTIIILILVILCLFPTARGQQGNGEEIFFKANQAYKDGRFEEAVKGYTDLLNMGHGNGHLFFNLGNA